MDCLAWGNPRIVLAWSITSNIPFKRPQCYRNRQKKKKKDRGYERRCFLSRVTTP